MRVDVVNTITQADTAAVWAVYDVVFGDEAYGEWLVSPWGRHTARPGFRTTTTRRAGCTRGSGGR